MIDVSDILADPDFLNDIQLLRQSDDGAIVDGIWTPTPTVLKKFRGSVQDPGDAMWETLPEGVRDRDALAIFTKFPLFAEVANDSGGGSSGDVVIWAGEKYKVTKNLDNWAHRGYRLFFAVKMEVGR